MKREVRGCLDTVIAAVEQRAAPPAAEAAEAGPGAAHSAADLCASDSTCEEAEILEGSEEADADEAEPGIAPGCVSGSFAKYPLCHAASSSLWKALPCRCEDILKANLCRLPDIEFGSCRVNATATAERLATNGHPRLKLYTLSCRLELYVQADIWQALSRYTCELCEFLHVCLAHLISRSVCRHGHATSMFSYLPCFSDKIPCYSGCVTVLQRPAQRPVQRRLLP